MKGTIQQYVDEHRDEMLSTLAQLVNMDSGTYYVEGVEAEASVLQSMLEDAGFTVERVPSDRFARHIKATKKGNGTKKLMFLGHMDTVFEQGTAKKRPFRVEGNYAYGPGVCDMKSGLLCTIYAMKALEAAGFRDYGELTILFDSDEERGSPTSEALIIETCHNKDAVLVVEAGMEGEYVVVERQGGGIMTMEITGKAAHAGGNPRDGINAIYEAAQKTIALHALTDYDKDKTVSVGVMKGGTQCNIIPDHVFMEIDVRCKVDADGKRLMDDMQKISDTQFVLGTVSKFTRVMYRPPIEKSAASVRLFEKLKIAAARVGTDVRERYCGGGTDGNYTSAEGIPTIDSLGPIGEKEHTDDEYILVDTYYSRTAMLGEFIVEICRDSDGIDG